MKHKMSRKLFIFWYCTLILQGISGYLFLRKKLVRHWFFQVWKFFMINGINQWKKDLFNIFDKISHFREKNKFKFLDCKWTKSFGRVWQSMRRRADVCIMTQGDHFQHLLYSFIFHLLFFVIFLYLNQIKRFCLFA